MTNSFKLFIRQIAPISDQEFDATISIFREICLQKGEYFVKQGSVCRQIGFINTGILRTFYQNEKGEDITSCFCTEHHLTTSYKSFIQQTPSELSIQALENCALLVINFAQLQQLYANSIAWQQIGRNMAEREYLVMEAYASVLNNDRAKEKYLRLLREQPEIIQKVPVQHIASYLGVTRRTLSRIRQEIAESR